MVVVVVKTQQQPVQYAISPQMGILSSHDEETTVLYWSLFFFIAHLVLIVVLSIRLLLIVFFLLGRYVLLRLVLPPPPLIVRGSHRHLSSLCGTFLLFLLFIDRKKLVQGEFLPTQLARYTPARKSHVFKQRSGSRIIGYAGPAGWVLHTGGIAVGIRWVYLRG